MVGFLIMCLVFLSILLCMGISNVLYHSCSLLSMSSFVMCSCVLVAGMLLLISSLNCSHCAFLRSRIGGMCLVMALAVIDMIIGIWSASVNGPGFNTILRSVLLLDSTRSGVELPLRP